MTTALVVFARAPQSAKRRLAAGIGRAAATRVAAALLDDTLARGAASGLAPLYLYWDGAREHSLLAAAEAAGYLTAIQRGADLGARMRNAFAQTLPEHERVLLIGTDCPDLDGDGLAATAAELSARDAVLIPARDGGYVAIGLARSALPCLGKLFSGIAWGDAGVAAATRRRLADCNLAHAESAPLADLDDAADFARLARRHAFLAALLQGEKTNTI